MCSRVIFFCFISIECPDDFSTLVTLVCFPLKSALQHVYVTDHMSCAERTLVRDLIRINLQIYVMLIVCTKLVFLDKYFHFVFIYMVLLFNVFCLLPFLLSYGDSKTDVSRTRISDGATRQTNGVKDVHSRIAHSHCIRGADR